jgi:beta-1,4-mannosyltransferase
MNIKGILESFFKAVPPPEDMEKLRVVPFPAKLKWNPYIDLLYGNLEKQGVEIIRHGNFSFQWLLQNRKQNFILHLHWLDQLIGLDRATSSRLARSNARRYTFLLKWARRLGYPIVWTVHNPGAHEGGFVHLEHHCRQMTAEITSMITHCKSASEMILDLYPEANKPSVIPHGHYCDLYPDVPDLNSARLHLKLPKESKIWLTLGLIRGYKGIPQLLEAFVEFSGPDDYLIIAGKPLTRAVAHEIEVYAQKIPRVILHFDYIPDEELPYYYQAADYVVLPFTKILTSGSLMLALSFAKPVLAPRMGCIPEIIDEGMGVLFDPDKAGGLLDGLIKMKDIDIAAAREKITAKLPQWNWHNIAERHIEVYRESRKK